MATIVHICTVPITLVFLGGLVQFLREEGHEVIVITSPGKELDAFAARESVKVVAIAMERNISPLKDLRALGQIWSALRQIKPDIVHAQTPKGGLLGMLAAAALGVPGRVYHLRGLRLSTTQGLTRALLKWAERAASSCSHVTIAVSQSLADEAKKEGVLWSKKVVVINSGQGVDAQYRFKPSPDRSLGQQLRATVNIPKDALVVGFIGRFAKDKGMRELKDAWQILRERDQRFHLLLVGDEDRADPIDLSALWADERVHHVPFMNDPVVAYEAIDVLAFPTYREGFPNVLLEAAAMEVPVVAARAVGAVDAVIDGETGLLVEVGDADELAARLTDLLEDSAKRTTWGHQSRERVLSEFRPGAIYEQVLAQYAEANPHIKARQP